MREARASQTVLGDCQSYLTNNLGREKFKTGSKPGYFWGEAHETQISSAEILILITIRI